MHSIHSLACVYLCQFQFPLDNCLLKHATWSFAVGDTPAVGRIENDVHTGACLYIATMQKNYVLPLWNERCSDKWKEIGLPVDMRPLRNKRNTSLYTGLVQWKILRLCCKWIRRQVLKWSWRYWRLLVSLTASLYFEQLVRASHCFGGSLEWQLQCIPRR